MSEEGTSVTEWSIKSDLEINGALGNSVNTLILSLSIRKKRTIDGIL